ncbi:MAG: hypothetical protein N2381_11145 [Armatimonadetes bacterium]|nr:hypothetical protein [Armatimonadota bacterium]
MSKSSLPLFGVKVIGSALGVRKLVLPAKEGRKSVQLKTRRRL